MAKGITVPVVQSGLEASIEAAAKKAGPLTLSATVDPSSFKRLAQPLGRVSGLATEFEKSIAASNARVIAFGASVGIINGVQNAFASLVKTTIEVEKSLTNIAVISGKTTEELQPFSRALFEIAKTTSQSFQTASEAALEFSRQGLSLDETLKRTQDALTLTRFTSLSAAEAVDVLTAAANSFGETGITTSEILNKLVAVDTKFAVSAEDLAKGLSRAGSIAQEVGVNFDELNAIVTIAQERTARGGAVIGNAFKTIFTRIRSDETIQALQSIGIYSFDAEGRLKPVVGLLEELAGKIGTLSETKRIEVLESIASKYNINVLTALVDDLGSTTSKFREARDISAGAQNEAYQRQIELNRTLDAVITRVVNSAAQLADTLGRIGVTDSLKSLLNFFDNILTGINDVIDSEGIGGTIAKGLISGLSGVFFKIGIPLLLAIFVKLTKDIAQFGAESLKTILGINKEVRERQALEQAVVNTLIKDQQVMATILSLSGDRRKQEEYLLSVYNRQLAALQQVQSIAANVAPALQAAGLSATSGTIKKRAAGGYLPAEEAKDVRRGVGGASPSSKVVEIPNFSFGGGKRGTMVANTSEYIVPNYAGGSGTAIFNQDMAKEYGLPPGAKKITASGGFVPASGFVPNFAAKKFNVFDRLRNVKKNADPIDEVSIEGMQKSAYLTLGDKVDPVGRFSELQTSAKQRLTDKLGDIASNAKIYTEQGKIEFVKINDKFNSKDLYGKVKAVSDKKRNKKKIEDSDIDSIVSSILPSTEGSIDEDVRASIRGDVKKTVMSNSPDPFKSGFALEDVLFKKFTGIAAAKNNRAWDLPARQSGNFKKTFGFSSEFGDIKSGTSVSSISSFIGKHINDPTGTNASRGYIPNFAELNDKGIYAGLVGETAPDNKPDVQSITKYVTPSQKGLDVYDTGIKSADSVTFDVYRVPKKNEFKLKSIREALGNTGKNLAIDLAREVTGGALGNNVAEQKLTQTFNPGSLQSFANTIFEASVGALLSDKSFQDYTEQSTTSLFDLNIAGNSLIKKNFGIKDSVNALEVKGASTPKLLNSIAEKIYKATAGGQDPFAKRTREYIDAPGRANNKKVATAFYKDGIPYVEKEVGIFEPMKEGFNASKYELLKKPKEGAIYRGAALGYVPNYVGESKDQQYDAGLELSINNAAQRAYGDFSKKKITAGVSRGQIAGQPATRKFREQLDSGASVSDFIGFQAATAGVPRPSNDLASLKFFNRDVNGPRPALRAVTKTPDENEPLAPAGQFYDLKTALAFAKAATVSLQPSAVSARKGASGYIPNFAGKYFYDPNVITKEDDVIKGEDGKDIKNATFKKILASRKKIDVLIGPVGSGKTTVAQKRGGLFLRKPSDVDLADEITILQTSHTSTKTGGISDNMRQILDAATGKIEYLDVSDEIITERRKARSAQAETGSIAGDTRSSKQIITGDQFAEKRSPVFVQAVQDYLKNKGKTLNMVSGASGYIPSFAENDPLKEAIGREVAAGVPPARVRVTQDGRLKNRDNPDGLAVINTRDEPNGKIPNDFRERGMRAAMASRGFVPNFADDAPKVDFNRSREISNKDYEDLRREINKEILSFKKGQVSREDLNKKVNDLSVQYKLSKDSATKLAAATDVAANKVASLAAAAFAAKASGAQPSPTSAAASSTDAQSNQKPFQLPVDLSNKSGAALGSQRAVLERNIQKAIEVYKAELEAGKNVAEAKKRLDKEVEKQIKGYQLTRGSATQVRQSVTESLGQGGSRKDVDLGKFLVLQSAVVGLTSAIQSATEQGSAAANALEGVSAVASGVATFVAIGTTLSPQLRILAAAVTGLASAFPLLSRLYEDFKDPAEKTAEALAKLGKEAERTGKKISPEEFLAVFQQQQAKTREEQTRKNVTTQIQSALREQGVSLNETDLYSIYAGLSASGSIGADQKVDPKVIKDLLAPAINKEPSVMQRAKRLSAEDIVNIGMAGGGFGLDSLLQEAALIAVTGRPGPVAQSAAKFGANTLETKTVNQKLQERVLEKQLENARKPQTEQRTDKAINTENELLKIKFGILDNIVKKELEINKAYADRIRGINSENTALERAKGIITETRFAELQALQEKRKVQEEEKKALSENANNLRSSLAGLQDKGLGNIFGEADIGKLQGLLEAFKTGGVGSEGFKVAFEAATARTGQNGNPIAGTNIGQLSSQTQQDIYKNLSDAANNEARARSNAESRIADVDQTFKDFKSSTQLLIDQTNEINATIAGTDVTISALRESFSGAKKYEELLLGERAKLANSLSKAVLQNKISLDLAEENFASEVSLLALKSALEEELRKRVPIEARAAKDEIELNRATAERIDQLKKDALNAGPRLKSQRDILDAESGVIEAEEDLFKNGVDLANVSSLRRNMLIKLTQSERKAEEENQASIGMIRQKVQADRDAIDRQTNLIEAENGAYDEEVKKANIISLRRSVLTKLIQSERKAEEENQVSIDTVRQRYQASLGAIRRQAALTEEENRSIGTTADLNAVTAGLTLARAKLIESNRKAEEQNLIDIAMARENFDAEANSLRRKRKLNESLLEATDQEDFNRQATIELMAATTDLAVARRKAVAALDPDNLKKATGNKIIDQTTQNLNQISAVMVEGGALTDAGVQGDYEKQANARIIARRMGGRTDLTYAESEDILKGRGETITDKLGRSGAILMDEAQSFQDIVGKSTPKLFADGMAEAMQTALNQADNLGEALRGVAMSFLKNLQSAFLQSASQQIVASILPKAAEGGYVKGYASGGLVTGGSGYKDDVPAMLSQGEYVIRKSSVEKYGAHNLSKLNSGEPPRFADGGIFLPGVRGQGQISGYKDLTAFANQRTTSGATDILSGSDTSAFASLEDQSSRLSAYALMNEDDTINQEIRSAQEQARNIMAEREAYRTAERKAFQKQLVGTVASAALSFGTSKLMGTFFGPKTGQIPDIAGTRELTEKIAPYDRIAGTIGGMRIPSPNIPKIDLPSPARLYENQYGKNFGAFDTDNFIQNAVRRIPGRAYGGMIPRFADGGSPTDKVPALVMGGEYIMSEKATKKYGKKFFDSINQGRAPRFADGGQVSTSEPSFAEKAASSSDSKAAGATNVSININVTGGTAETQTQGDTKQGGVDYKKMSEQIKQVVIQTINEEKRLGGSLRPRG